MTSDCCLPAPPGAIPYVPDEIIIYGTKLNIANYASIAVPQIAPGDNATRDTVRIQLFREGPGSKPGGDGLRSDQYAVVIAYGYAYEGHCYRLERPKILLFSDSAQEFPAHGCGFDNGNMPFSQYSMWRIRSKTMLLELNVTTDFAESVLLEANLPGRRAPNTYSAQMVVAHRGGRLTGTRSEV